MLKRLMQCLWAALVALVFGCLPTLTLASDASPPLGLAPWALADLAGPNSMSDNSNLADAARGSPSGNLAPGSPTCGAQDSATVRRE